MKFVARCLAFPFYFQRQRMVNALLWLNFGLMINRIVQRVIFLLATTA